MWARIAASGESWSQITEAQPGGLGCTLSLMAPGDKTWAEPPPGRVFRVVSEPLPSKGRLRYMGCGPEGRMGLALQEKDVGGENRGFERLLLGTQAQVMSPGAAKSFVDYAELTDEQRRLVAGGNLARLLKPLGVRVTRIAMGIPVGSGLEYADEVTMSKALEHRHEI